MTLTDEIQQMKANGAADEDILSSLQSRGISAQQAYEAIQQATIRDAVNQDPQQESSLQSSIMSQQVPEAQEAQYSQEPQYAPQEYSQEAQYSSQQAYSPTFSADTITEIADQVLSEKLSSVREGIETILDFKTSAESKISSIDERLQRIEKIIDRLQLSILQKVGESITNIEDLKKELLETQKSFSAATKHHQK